MQIKLTIFLIKKIIYIKPFLVKTQVGVMGAGECKEGRHVLTYGDKQSYFNFRISPQKFYLNYLM